MTGPILLVVVLGAIVASTVIVKVATIALMLTGLDEKRARFQALSAFTGTGFTTREAELVVSNTRRRKIIMVVMILGYSSLAVVMATLIASFIQSKGLQIPIHIIILAGCIYILYRLATYEKWIRRWDRIIEDLINRKKIIDKQKIEDVLQFDPRFGIVGVTVHPESELVGKTLSELALAQDNILILTVQRGTTYIHAPSGKQDLQTDDFLILYGNRHQIRERFSKEA